MKLDVPRFDGTNALGWIFKINQFFAYHETPEAERLTVASFYMEGPALGWYQWMASNGQISSWSALLQALEARFAPSQYDDPKGALFKLTQTGSVNDYLSQFEFHKGLCFNCEEKFHKGHKCSSQFFLLIMDDDVSLESQLTVIPPAPDLPTDPGPDPNPDQAKISFHALSGHLAPETLRLVGRVSNHNVVLLVDGGSTHNFIQERLVKSLGLTAQPTSSLKVMVGNGNEIDCHQVCPQVKIHIQSHVFTVDVHVLALSGADIVLGVQWLKSLGPILTDYNDLTMKFVQSGKIVELKGDRDGGLHLITAQQVKRLLHTQGASAFFHIQVLTPEPPSTQIMEPQLHSLLQKYGFLFSTPTSLPPPRNTNHTIHLLPQSQPVNVRPYRYPYFQKQEIEKQVEQMLSNGIIRPSTSPFSSPVLLVKEKDGSWRFCVDYRALNTITIKDRFPIPTVDELLDELGERLGLPSWTCYKGIIRF
jgi:hypothetical protein